MKPCTSLLLLALLAGCAARPEPHIYILGTAAELAAGVRDDTARKVIELKPVLIPDHLDTTDILIRSGTNELKASETGIWGERLSVGVTQALAGALARRIPSALVVARTPPARPALQVLVDVTALQSRTGGACVLTAHWTILRPSDDAGTSQTLASAQGNFTTHGDGPSDGAVVAAITSAIDQLADQIARGVRS
jgi:uncharacterized lipoprotein YmbA